MKEDDEKYFKKLTLFLFSNLVWFNRYHSEKQKRPGTSDQSLFRLQNKFKKVPLLVMYYLTKYLDIIKSGFGVFPKITSANLYKPVHNMISYSTFIFLFEAGKCGKEGENYKKLNLSRMKRNF